MWRGVASTPSPALKPRLLRDLDEFPGARILEGNFTAVQQAIGTAEANEASAAFLRDFVDNAKVSGLVARLIGCHQVRGRRWHRRAGTAR